MTRMVADWTVCPAAISLYTSRYWCYVPYRARIEALSCGECRSSAGRDGARWCGMRAEGQRRTGLPYSRGIRPARAVGRGSGPERFVLDLSDLAFADCCGARALAAAVRAVPGHCALSPSDGAQAAGPAGPEPRAQGHPGAWRGPGSRRGPSALENRPSGRSAGPRRVKAIGAARAGRGRWASGRLPKRGTKRCRLVKVKMRDTAPPAGTTSRTSPPSSRTRLCARIRT